MKPSHYTDWSMQTITDAEIRARLHHTLVCERAGRNPKGTTTKWLIVAETLRTAIENVDAALATLDRMENHETVK